MLEVVEVVAVRGPVVEVVEVRGPVVEVVEQRQKRQLEVWLEYSQQVAGAVNQDAYE